LESYDIFIQEATGHAFVFYGKNIAVNFENKKLREKL
jgi:hypothetical protein